MMEQKIIMPEIGFDMPITDLVLELEKLRYKVLEGTTHPLVFMQIKNVFHMLESIGSSRIEGNNTTIMDYVESTKINDENRNRSNEQILEILNIEKATSFIEPKEIELDVVEIKLDKSNLDIPYNGTAYLSVDGIELDKCNIRIEDDFYAYASTSNDKIEIKAYKVGTTKVIVSYGQNKAECTLHITPINDFCGNPILQFDKTYSEVKDMCSSVTNEVENVLTCREGNVLHHYLFNDEKLTIVVSHVKKLENTVSYFLDAANSMDERYKRLTSVGNNIHWYQEYKQQIYIASVEDEQNKDWYFFYSPSKELIEKNIERYKR